MPMEIGFNRDPYRSAPTKPTDKNTAFEACAEFFDHISAESKLKILIILQTVNKFTEGSVCFSQRQENIDNRNAKLQELKRFVSEALIDSTQRQNVEQVVEHLCSIIKNNSFFIKRKFTGKNYQLIKKYLPDVSKVEDPSIQIEIANAIRNGVFQGDDVILKLLAKSLGTMKLTDPKAQRHIVNTIITACNYCSTAVQSDSAAIQDNLTCQILAKSLGTMKLTDPEAQILIAHAINNDMFGQDDTVLAVLAKSLGTMKLTDPDPSSRNIRLRY